MEYRKLPHGQAHERFSVIGLGLGGIQNASDAEIEQVLRHAIDQGLNFFDLCAGGKNVFAPAGRGMKGHRHEIFLQMHFGAIYNEQGEYAWTRDLDTIKQTFDWELTTLETDYTDMGYVHCLDEAQDFENLFTSGLFEYLMNLKTAGTIRHLGFSSHTPSVAKRMLDTGVVDMMMFSINPAYDFERGDEYGVGTFNERTALFQRCAAEGIGISVMKAFHAGQLLDAKTSPFRAAFTKNQCLQYALDRPGVLTVLPGVSGLSNLNELLTFFDAPEAQKDYSILGTFSSAQTAGNCVYCNHCQPCPVGINIGLVNKYYDLAFAGDRLAVGHYDKLAIKADACQHCGHCDAHCPFDVPQSQRMAQIDRYFRSQ